MATNDPITRPCDQFAVLADAYEALALLAHSERGGSDPVYSMLLFLNAQFRRLLDEAEARGCVS